jgi:ATP-dependent helicase/nuclease subunit A
MARVVEKRFVPEDQAQRDRIRYDLDSNLCVEAGAGTGKTTVLVSRIVELLRSGRVSIDEIAVITFTEKAAAELAARVRDGLEKAQRECPEDDVTQREALTEALLGLHRARIETIHAFAANILRERPIEAKLDPNFDVQEGIAAGLAFEGAYSEWIETLFGSESVEGETLRRLLNRGFDTKQVRATVDALHDHRYALPLERFPAVPEADLDRFMAETERIVSELESIAARATDAEDGLVVQLPVAREYLEELRAVRNDCERLERAVLERYPGINLNVGRRGSWDDSGDCELMKDKVRELRELIKTTCKGLKSQALADFLPFAEGFVLGYTTKRRSEGHADYDDLLLWARDILRDELDVRAYFQRRFRSVLVDVFQDTDPILAELVA